LTALFISIACGIIIICSVFPKLSAYFETLSDISRSFNVSSQYIDIVIKITGISYLAEFCSQLCTDCGETSLASKVELSAKVFITGLSMPVIFALINSLNTLMP
jgi:stage III sporulation protein AD